MIIPENLYLDTDSNLCDGCNYFKLKMDQLTVELPDGDETTNYYISCDHRDACERAQKLQSL